ncbi:MAG: hypothetical protein KDE27_11565, partial [Planctomycetes bacterium]|nr:hypothetical protein [Planctomycetota bacterium]
MTRRIGALFLVVGAAGGFAAPAAAQDWRTEAVPEARIEITAPSRLERLPMRYGETGPYHRARFMSKDLQDTVRGYAWQTDVYIFPKKSADDGGIAIPKGMPPEAAKEFKAAMAQFGAKSYASFKAWLDAQKKVEIIQDGKAMRAKNGKLAYEHWVWRYENGWGPTGVCWCEAAVYDFDGQQSALVIEIPLEKADGKPKSKWKNIISKMIRSGDEYEVTEAALDTSDKRFQYADTPAKKAALEKAMANIANLDGWDLFTQPNYIVLYSWDFEKSDQANKAKKLAEFYAERLEKMRELYTTLYPLDATGTKAVWPDPATIPDLGGPITGAKANKDKPLSPEEKE